MSGIGAVDCIELSQAVHRQQIGCLVYALEPGSLRRPHPVNVRGRASGLFEQARSCQAASLSACVDQTCVDDSRFAVHHVVKRPRVERRPTGVACMLQPCAAWGSAAACRPQSPAAAFTVSWEVEAAPAGAVPLPQTRPGNTRGQRGGGAPVSHAPDILPGPAHQWRLGSKQYSAPHMSASANL